jgi:hypothetical protein
LAGFLVAGVNQEGKFLTSWAADGQQAWTLARRLGLTNWRAVTEDGLPVERGTMLEWQPESMPPAPPQPERKQPRGLPRISFLN